MEIVILTSDFSGNSLARSYLLAQLLQNHHRVRIVGPMFGEDIWPPLKNTKDVDFFPIKMKPSNLYVFAHINKIVNQCNSDLLYVSKPLLSSFVPGIIAKYKYKIPLILDIDDWELSPFLLEDKIHRVITGLRRLNHPISFFPNLAIDNFIKLADLITVSSTFLQSMYGGVIIPHVRKIGNINRKLNFSQTEKIILFLGTPRPHKGVTDLIDAFKLVNKKNTILWIVGIDPNDRDSQNIILAAKSDNRVRLMGPIPFVKLPFYIAAADIVVIPQRNTIVGKAQVPAKIFDAMAQGKAIISTRISDIPIIIGDAGIIIEPSNIPQLANAIEYLLEHPEERQKLGEKARKRYEEFFKFDSISSKLNILISKKFND